MRKVLLLRLFRVFGLICLISYVIVIIALWMFYDLTGYTYFMLGELNPIIKWGEWIIGVYGILTGLYFIKNLLTQS